MTERVLVAHNARFDYGFLKAEFARVGIKYSTKPLCSVKFSRLMYPQFPRHGLSQIIKRFNFDIKNRHRALDDAKVIYDFFLESSVLLFNESCRNGGSSELWTISEGSHVPRVSESFSAQVVEWLYAHPKN